MRFEVGDDVVASSSKVFEYSRFSNNHAMFQFQFVFDNQTDHTLKVIIYLLIG
jgi:hypothetical protein